MFVTLSLLGCGGPSDQEKKDVADSTCAILKETTENQSAFRVKELNAARATIGEKPFVDGDEIIQNSIKFGLCNNLVVNTPDFNQKYSLKLDVFREKVAENTCEELDLSYALSEVTEDDRGDYYYSQIKGYHNEEYSESINQKKLTIINLARKTLREPAFSGSVSTINKYQFFGLCESLVKNDIRNVQAIFESYEEMFSDSEHNNILKNVIVLDSQNNPYLFRSGKKENLNSFIPIKLSSKAEIPNINFYGSIVFTDEDYKFISKFKYAIEFNNERLVSAEISYPNNQLKHQTKFQSSGTISSERNWYINGTKFSEEIFQDGLLSSLEEWNFKGELSRRFNYKKGIPHGFHENFLEGKLWTQVLYKDGKKNGVQRNWSIYGELEEITTFKNGKKDGVYKKWGGDWFSQSDVWELLEQSFYKDDLKHGAETKWSIESDGGTYIREKNNYLNGKLHGESITYYSDGTLYKRLNYLNGLKHGIQEEFGMFTNKSKDCYQNDVQVELEVCKPTKESDK